MYTAYGDESADETRTRVFTIAGLLGDNTDWAKFRKNWKDRTGDEVFHATACDSDHEPYKQTGHRENKKLYADLSHIIADSNLLGYAISISLPDYKELIAPCLDDNPYYLCFQGVVIYLGRKAALCIPPDRIEFIFDRNYHIEYNAGALYDRIINANLRPEMESLMSEKVSFATREEAGIQAADLVAREGMKLLDNRSGPVSRPTRLATQVLQASQRVKFKVYDRGYFERIIRDSREHQYPQTEFFDWLEKHGLNNTLSNRLRYELSRDPPKL
jgi:hypothetical protein